MSDILNRKLGALSITKIGRELLKSLGRKGMIEKVISTGDNATIIKSMPKYQKFIKDNFDVTVGLYRTKTDIQGTRKRFKAGEWISARDVASVLDKHFDELKQFPPATDDGELYILAGTVANLIANDTKIEKRPTKENTSNIIPDFMKESKTRHTMKKSELKRMIIEELKNIINTSQSMPIITPSKSEYDKLKSTGRVLISRLSTGFSHTPSPQTYKRYPKGQYEIIVKNPYNKGNEIFWSKTNHTAEGVYLEITELD